MEPLNLHSPIFVTGIERSGATIVARILQQCGAFTGTTTEMCENRGLKTLVDIYYRNTLHLPEFGQKPLPNTRALKAPKGWVTLIPDILANDGLKNNQIWLYKNHRIAQIWPVWHTLYPDAKWIIVRRRTGEIVQSCMKTGFMKAYDDTKGWLKWVHEQEASFIEMIEAGVNCIEVWPDRMVYGDFTQMQDMVKWLGLEWNPSVVSMIHNILRNSIRNEH